MALGQDLNSEVVNKRAKGLPSLLPFPKANVTRDLHPQISQ